MNDGAKKAKVSGKGKRQCNKLIGSCTHDFAIQLIIKKLSTICSNNKNNNNDTVEKMLTTPAQLIQPFYRSAIV